MFDECKCRTPDEDVRTLPFEKFRRTMQVWRDSVSPPIPESLAHWAHLLEDEVYRHRGAALPENEDESNQRPLYRGLIGGHSILFVSDALKRYEDTIYKCSTFYFPFRFWYSNKNFNNSKFQFWII